MRAYRAASLTSPPWNGATPRIDACSRKPTGEKSMNEPPPSNNVAAAICNVFVPGLGQLVQGRFLAAALFFSAWILAWCCCLGFIPHYWSIIDAAVWRPKPR